MYLNLLVRRQSIIQALPKEDFVADSRNYLVAKFHFETEEWKNSDLKYALFEYEGKTYKQILGADPKLNFNECRGPPEVIKTPGFSVSVYGGDLITTAPLMIRLKPSGYTTKIENQETTPSVLEQMNSLMARYAKICNQILQDCEQIKQDIQK